MKPFRRVAHWTGSGPWRAVLACTALLAAAAFDAGAQASVAASKDPIVIGGVGPLSGPMAVLSPVFDGMNSAISTYNEAGGVNGRPIKFVVRDDQFNPANTPGVTRDLVETENVLMICGTTGSPNNASVKNYLAARGVPAIPTSGSETLLNDSTFEVIASYTQLGYAIASFAINEKKFTKVAVAYSPDATGQPVADAVRAYLKSKGMDVVAAERYDPNAPSFATQAAALKASGAEMVIANSAAPVFARLINAAKQIGYEPVWGSTFAAANTSLVALTNGTAKGRTFFSTPFQLTDSAEATTYRETVKKYYPKVDTADPLVIQGWTVGLACAEALKAAARKAGGAPLTRKHVIDALTGLKIDNDYIKGLEWTKEDHSGAKQAQVIGISADGKFERAAPFRKF